jgi:predicted outer membrane repeat protein
MRHGIVATLSRRAALGFVTSIVAVLACTGVASAASYTVNDTTDAPLATSTDTNCVSSQPGGTCTLRAAVQAANNVGGPSTITVPAGTYTLSTDNTLDINGNANGTAITVTGASSSTTVIDGIDDVSIFRVEKNGGLSLSGLKLQNGSNFDGGAIYSDGALAVTSDVQFVGNDAYTGGAIYSDFDPSSTLSLNGATFTSNAANNSGGAIYYDSPNPASITNTSFNKNSAFGCNGGCDSRFSGDGGAILPTTVD